MSTFHDQFTPDLELDGTRRIWKTTKPLLRNMVVQFAPYSPEYPKLKLRKSELPSCDPSCPSARDVSDELEVIVYSHRDQYGDAHELAWNYILEHTAEIEANLRRKLVARHVKYLKQCREEELAGATHLHKYWKTIEKAVNLDDPSAIDHFFKLVGVGLADHGLDECGFSSFEFQTGWDRDHGLGILMHKNHVLTAGGMTESICGPNNLVDGVKYDQTLEMDDGDWSLLDAK